ncbi:MAG TPA: tetratricopeptide repeat protein [Anaeromyxobacter sp.]|nr:tetratricopeptide repeat protein [Anaeromyxobacter sp.]
MHQADERIPPISAFPPGEQRIAYNEALTHEQAGWRAEQGGRAQEARQPLEAAARSFLAFLQRFPRTGWDLTFRFHAADLLRRAGRGDEAAALAEQVANDPGANPKSKAMASLQLANALTTAGKLEPLKIEAPAEGERAAPAEVPAPWARYVEATDAYLQSLGPAAQEPPDRILGPGQLALVAARVAWATGHRDDARGRLETILDRWSGEPQAFQGAAPLYVQTFVAEQDWNGAGQAVERVQQLAAAQGQQATDQDARGAYEKVSADVARVAASAGYERAKGLLEQGKAEEAAREFEALAERGQGDVPAALVGAAVAWEKAGDARRATELRQQVVDRHGDSRLAPGAALQIAASLSKQGDHGGAARVYAMHAERWPDDPNHCTALRNGAVELDVAKRAADAAGRYLAFGKDERCAQASPDVAALALYRAGQLFIEAKRRPEAREAFQAAAAIEGVTSREAKQRVADAKRQASKLGGTAAGRRSPRR